MLSVCFWLKRYRLAQGGSGIYHYFLFVIDKIPWFIRRDNTAENILLLCDLADVTNPYINQCTCISRTLPSISVPQTNLHVINFLFQLSLLPGCLVFLFSLCLTVVFGLLPAPSVWGDLVSCHFLASYDHDIGAIYKAIRLRFPVLCNIGSSLSLKGSDDITGILFWALTLHIFPCYCIFVQSLLQLQISKLVLCVCLWNLN